MLQAKPEKMTIFEVLGIMILSLFIAILITLFTAPMASAGEAIVSWGANQESDLSGYNIYYGNAPGDRSTKINVGNKTSHTISGLADGTYFFVVTAYDTSGNESGFSVEVNKPIINATTPPILSGTNATNISNTAASITWNTDNPATSLVEYGTTNAYDAASPLNSTFVTLHNRTLTGLQSSTQYHYRVISTDANGTTAISGDFTFTTTATPDNSPPFLLAITSNNITNNTAVITWNTDKAASSLVEYGTTSAFGETSPVSNTFVTLHNRTLTGLQPSTQYYYRVTSTGTNGATAISGDLTFTTTATPDNSPPFLSAITSSNITNDSAVITWNTNETATSRIEFGTSTQYGATSSLDSSLVLQHSQTLSNLLSSTTYNYRVISIDSAGNTSISGNITFRTTEITDTTGPVFFSVRARNINDTEATIKWHTDEASTSRVEYGLITSPDEASTPTNTTLVTAHQMTLSNLTPSTTYYFRAISSDITGNTTSSQSFFFNTSDTPGSALGNIDDTGSGSISENLETTTSAMDEAQGSTSDSTTNMNSTTDILTFTNMPGDQKVTLSWTNPANKDFLGVRIRFRTDRPPTDVTDGVLIGDFTGQPGEARFFIHEDLNNGETYHYLAVAYDTTGTFHTIVRTTSTPDLLANEGDQSQAGGGAGCGMIDPRNGNPPGPGDAAGMLTIMGALLLILFKKESKTFIGAPVSD